MTEMLLPVSATEEVVEVAGAEVAALALPLPQTIGVMADRAGPEGNKSSERKSAQ